MIVNLIIGAVLIVGAIISPDFTSAAIMLVCGVALLISTAVLRSSAIDRAHHINRLESELTHRTLRDLSTRPTAPEAEAVQTPPPDDWNDVQPEEARPPAPDVAAGTATEPLPTPARTAEIVTRTNANDGPALRDPYVTEDREWTADELRKALAYLDAGHQIEQIATLMTIDQRQVAIKLVRTIFGVTGVIDDEESAANSGKRYSRQDEAYLRDAFIDGTSLVRIAQTLGRSPLGAGWRLINLRPQVVFSGSTKRSSA